MSAWEEKMKREVRRDNWVMGLIVAAMLVWIIVGVELAHGAKKGKAVPIPPGFLPWPNHIEWSAFKTPTGFMLCRPSTPTDSTTMPIICLDLPEGTEVYILRVVPGLSSEDQQDQRWRNARRHQ